MKIPNGALQTIATRYIDPTETKPARIKATATGGTSFTMSCDHMVEDCIDNDFKNHQTVAQALADQNDWPYDLIGGTTKTGYVFVLISESDFRHLCKLNFS